MTLLFCSRDNAETVSLRNPFGLPLHGEDDANAGEQKMPVRRLRQMNENDESEHANNVIKVNQLADEASPSLEMYSSAHGFACQKPTE